MGAGASFEQRITIVGGGYNGSALAYKLRNSFEVTLVEKDDSMTHHIGAVRGLVAPGFERNLRMDYVNTVGDRGTLIQARATKIESGRVTLEDGRVIESDFVVIATGGSGYRQPLRMEDSSNKDDYFKALQESQQIIKDASSILVVGGGPTGLEITGEIKHVYPDKKIILAHSRDQLLSNFNGTVPEKPLAQISQQLQALGVDVRLGARVQNLPEGNVGVAASPGAEYKFANGDSVKADAVVVATGQRAAPPAAAALVAKDHLTENGLIKVDDHFAVQGLDNVFCIGDAAGIPEGKTLFMTQNHVKYLANELPARASGKTNKPYAAGQEGMAVTLGPKFGAGFMGTMVFPGSMVAGSKGKTLMVDKIPGERGLVVPPVA